MDRKKDAKSGWENENPKREGWIKIALQAYRGEGGRKYYENKEREAIGEFIGNVIAGELAHLPLPRRADRSIVLSTASNVGIMERGIQRALEGKMRVISADLGTYKRVGGTMPLQADAARLPFANDSVPVIVDILGGAWHDLLLDKAKRGDDFGSAILEEYRKKLMEGGMLVFDAWKEGKASTSELIDEVLGGSTIEGFSEPELYTDEEGKYSVRVYRKLASEEE